MNTVGHLPFFVYILRCADGSYYTGHTDNLELRMAQHRAGEIPGYTQDRRPVDLAFSAEVGSRSEALERERQIKRWSRAKKEALVAGDWDGLRHLAGQHGGPDSARQETPGDVARVRSAIKRLAEGRTTPLLVALDGRSGAGKSTLAREVAEAVGGRVVDCDDFYAGGTFEEWARRSAREKADLVIDWRRLRREVIEPLRAGRAAVWHPIDWTTMMGLSPDVITCEPAPVVILDGAYSARPELSDLVDLRILVQLPDAVRRERLRLREGADYVERWHAVWDEAEDYYFTQVRPPSSFDVVIDRE
jgi:predicted GIY-YIG superfamily endonuclease/uridine kinase